MANKLHDMKLNHKLSKSFLGVKTPEDLNRVTHRQACSWGPDTGCPAAPPASSHGAASGDLSAVLFPLFSALKAGSFLVTHRFSF